MSVKINMFGPKYQDPYVPNLDLGSCPCTLRPANTGADHRGRAALYILWKWVSLCIKLFNCWLIRESVREHMFDVFGLIRMCRVFTWQPEVEYWMFQKRYKKCFQYVRVNMVWEEFCKSTVPKAKKRYYRGVYFCCWSKIVGGCQHKFKKCNLLLVFKKTRL